MCLYEASWVLEEVAEEVLGVLEKYQQFKQSFWWPQGFKGNSGHGGYARGL